MVLLKTGPSRSLLWLFKKWALWAPGALDHGHYGPQGPWAQPCYDCVAVPAGGFFFGRKGVNKKELRISDKINVRSEIFVISANVDLNLRLQMYKIAI